MIVNRIAIAIVVVRDRVGGGDLHWRLRWTWDHTLAVEFRGARLKQETVKKVGERIFLLAKKDSLNDIKKKNRSRTHNRHLLAKKPVSPLSDSAYAFQNIKRL
jgi:hypothetical protein